MEKAIKSLALIFFATAVSQVSAQTLEGGQVSVRNMQVKKDGRTVKVDMDFNLDKLDLESNRGLVYTPMLVNGDDTLKLPAAEFMGRKRYIYYQRNSKTSSTAPVLVARRYNGTEQTEHYSYNVDYLPWLQGSQMVIGQGTCGCDQALIGTSNDEKGGTIDLFGGPWRFEYAYVQPKAEAVKRRAESGTARLRFVVNKYDINSKFDGNAAELDKIQKTIDLVRNDEDVTLTGIELHGYASPDGSYALNEKLARNRTEALKKYLKGYYSVLQDDIFKVESTAEDWDGVRSHVAASSVGIKDELLEIIDSDMTPDEKDRAFAMNYGDYYRSVLLKDVYPLLRRTDYKVTYNVRNFNLDEARRIIKERPQKLSLNEMYLVANSYEKGSDDFKHVFDVAVRMFPENETANLNAAVVALSRGDKESATAFLKLAGNSAEAQNARGILAVQNGDYNAAKQYFEAARTLPEAQKNLDELVKRM